MPDLGSSSLKRRHEDQRIDEGVHPVEAPAAPRRPESLDLIRIEFCTRDGRAMLTAMGVLWCGMESAGNSIWENGNSQTPTPNSRSSLLLGVGVLEVGSRRHPRTSDGSRTAPSAPAPRCAAGTASVVLSCVPMPQFGRLNALNTSAISVERHAAAQRHAAAGSGSRCGSAAARADRCAERSCRPDAGAG